MKPKTCIRITGTRTGKLRARVEKEGQPRFEVTLGGDKWETLPRDLQEKILERATAYLNKLRGELAGARPPAYTLKDLPNSYGEHMTLEEFRDCLRAGAIISSDGIGYYATSDKETNIPVVFMAEWEPTPKDLEITHVMWYNK